MADIRAEPTSWFSWDFDLSVDPDQAILLKTARFCESGGFSWAGREYVMQREAWLSGDFLLQEGGQVLATATKEALLRRFVVHLGQRGWILRAASPFRRRFHLFDGHRLVGEVVPDQLFTRRCVVTFPDDLTIPLQVFLFWLVVLMWRRGSHAASS